MGSDMEEPNQDDFESREYQQELFDTAVERNLILYLPTGSGKTFIATMLIKHFSKLHNVVEKSIEDGGKRSFFLVNTVALVQQQKKQISMQTPLSVDGYSGDMGVDFWDIEKWKSELNENKVLVMTAQIFLDLIEKNILSLKSVNLLIFDECHRGVSNHPFRQIMKHFEKIPDEDRPRVLGLTATLLNGNIKPTSVPQELKKLENTFISQIATSVNEEMVKMFSTNPTENRVTYRPNDCSGLCYQQRNQIFSNLKMILERVRVEEPVEPVEKPSNAKQIDSNYNKINKRLKNLLDDIQVNMDDLGVYGGSMAVLAHLVQLQQMLLFCPVEVCKILYQAVIADSILLRTLFAKEMSRPLPSERRIQSYSSDKVNKLLGILKKTTSSDSAIVFVKRRFTAKILYYILKNASQLDPKLSHVKANFIVGYTVGNPFKDTRENYLQRAQNTRVMNQFNSRELNVLFASNVVEEGIDISKCNYVIMFDHPTDFRSYIQSKGRARDKNSKYILMVCETDRNFLSQYNLFCDTEASLKQLLCGGRFKERTSPTKAELNEELFANTPGLETYAPLGRNGPVITALSAISLINRYFATLKQDKFTKITPVWWIKRNGNKCKCFLQLPMESKTRGLIEGTWQSNKEDAKRSVALEACKKLHSYGELADTNLLPVGLEIPEVEVASFMPNKDNNEVFKTEVDGKTVLIGTKKNKRTCDKKWAESLANCRPMPNEEIYVHPILIKPTYTPPTDNNRLLVLHKFLCKSNTFAILSSKKLPKLASFPLYMSTGELEAEIEDPFSIYLKKDEVQKISTFHGQIFDKVLGVSKQFMIRDNSNGQNSYLIAPVTQANHSKKMTIDWSAMEELNLPLPSISTKPTDEERKNLKITDEIFLGKVVSPWYRTVPTQKYLVTKVCYDMSEKTTFPTETYSTYEEYFADKYSIEPFVPNQPLLEVRALSNRINSIKPRSLTKQLRKNKDENEDFEVWLLPEFCVMYPLPGWYWLKTLLLPSILHRISQLSLAEELRVSISKETGIGPLRLPEGKNWSKLEQDVSLIKEAPAETQQALTPLTNLFMNFNLMRPPQSIWGDDEEPADVERQMESVTIFDVLNYEHFIKMPLHNSASNGKLNFSEKLHKKSLVQMIDPPTLQMLKKTKEGIGPEQVEIVQALTTAGANDFISCERLETLGDSFLKFAISIMLFECQPDWSEGHLTNVKGMIVGNKNLYFCGKKKAIGSMLEVREFSPRVDWIAPGFCVEQSVQGVIRLAKLDPNCLYNVTIPEEERTAGVLSKATLEKFNDVLLNGDDATQSQTCTFINQLSLSDKNISDAVEAILGAYLQSSGIFGALKVMNWFGVTDPQKSRPEIFYQTQNSSFRGKGDVGSHLMQPDMLEEILNYKFKDRSNMLQAVSHPSYSNNTITQCYQRLEFLGDALIDFLITVHIFEKCRSLSPGDLTDLRSALVNNITLACIAVKNEFHKFLLHRSSKLNEVVMRFVNHQDQKNHKIDSDVLFLLEENEVNISESVEVPKALGDIFEALIGAIYLDCGKNIDIVWKILYNLMKDEIANFCDDVPKNHVRLLYESGTTPEFSSSVASDGAVMVEVAFSYRGELRKCHGFGDNSRQAKRAAAKHALRLIRSSSTK